MARVGIKSAFGAYDTTLTNVQWSVSAWAPDGALVVSLWDHHYRKGPPGTFEFADKVSRWGGPGNSEFRRNVAEAFRAKKPVKLVVVRLEKMSDVARVQAGEDASKMPKMFQPRDDVIGEVVLWDDENYVIRFWPP